MPKTFVLSDENKLNSYGFRVMTAGIILDRFKANPVMLFMHKRYGEDYKGPIGKWNSVRSENGQLLAESDFDAKDDFAAEIEGKVERGYLKGASIGIIDILEYTEDPEFMLPGQKLPTVTKCIISEASIVDIPSNELSVALYDRMGKIMQFSEEGFRAHLSASGTEPLFIHKMKFKLFAMALKLNEDADESAVLAAINKQTNDLAERDATILRLNAQIKEQRDAEINLALEEAENQGKIAKGSKEEYRAMATADLAAFKKLMQSTPKPVKPIDLVTGQAGAIKTAGDRSDWKLKDWHKNDYAGLMKLKAEDPDQYKEILNRK